MEIKLHPGDLVSSDDFVFGLLIEEGKVLIGVRNHDGGQEVYYPRIINAPADIFPVNPTAFKSITRSLQTIFATYLLSMGKDPIFPIQPDKATRKTTP